MKRNYLFTLLILILIFFSIFFFIYNKGITASSFEECAKRFPVMDSYPEQCRTPDGKLFTKDIGDEFKKQDLVRVSSPRPGQEIKSPLKIEGEAVGFWFFEANFSINLYDENGNLVAFSIAEAKDDWMTGGFVPFVSVLEFGSVVGRGNLILEKSNPSGLIENNDSFRIPVLMSK